MALTHRALAITLSWQVLLVGCGAAWAQVDPESVIPPAARETAPASIVLPAMPPRVSCDALAIDQSGAPLVGPARISFLTRCDADARHKVDAICAEKAIDKSGKKLSGPAKAAHMETCAATVKGK
jgi:hypothetical protein